MIGPVGLTFKKVDNKDVLGRRLAAEIFRSLQEP